MRGFFQRASILAATLPGTTCDATAELMAQRMVTAALSNSFLPQGSFQGGLV